MKANLVAPKGMLPIKIDSNIRMLRNLDNDDDFFHASCHVAQALRSKIESGEYIELDKLLPREKAIGTFTIEDDRVQPIQLMTRNGLTYLTPSNTESKITNLCKWDQAFRVYSTIYTKANPERLSEILQYIHIIHTGVGAYSWSNVAFYDFMFRRLMATKPCHSWAKTYNLGWNLALKDPTMKAFNYTGQGASGNSATGGQSNSVNGKSKTWKDDCCWHFNKGNNCKNGTNCKWDHRCTYCGIWNHSFSNCRKRLGKNRDSKELKEKSQSPQNK